MMWRKRSRADGVLIRHLWKTGARDFCGSVAFQGSGFGKPPKFFGQAQHFFKFQRLKSGDVVTHPSCANLLRVAFSIEPALTLQRLS
jgi:hypothetical protein